MSDQININVNGSEIRTDSDQLIIEACEDSGIHIPRFCWHKRMDPVGMCRMCLVEIETPRGKALIPSCTTKVSEDLVVDTESEVVKKAQEGVLEFLLIKLTVIKMVLVIIEMFFQMIGIYKHIQRSSCTIKISFS